MKIISVDESMSAGIKKVVAENSIDIEIQADGGDLKIEDTSAEKQDCTLSVLPRFAGFSPALRIH